VVEVRSAPVTRPSESVPLLTVSAPPPVADILRSFTGVEVKDYGGVGGLKTVNVRSLGSEHTAIFLDGIPVENAQNLQVDLGRFSSDDLGSVSLWHGQRSALLQSAREYSGANAVYLESVRPILIENRPHLRVRLKGGSFGTLSPSLRLDKNIGRTTVRASADYLRSDGRYPYTYLDTTLTRENGDIRSFRAETQVWGSSRKGNWTARAYGYGSDRGFPGPVVRRAEGFPLSAERQQDLDLFLQGNWKAWWSDRYATALRFKAAGNRTRYATHPEKNPMALPLDCDYFQQSAYLSFAQSFTPIANLSLDLASDVQFNHLDASTRRMDPMRLTIAEAAALRWIPSPRTAFSASLGWQGARERDGTFRSAWTPGVTASWEPVRDVGLQGFAKRSWRLPSFNDLYYTLAGNAALEAESAFQTGLTLRWARPPRRHHAFGWEVQAEPYCNRVRNKIVAVPTSSQFRWSMMNIGKVDITGAELKASGAWRSASMEVSLTGRYAFQQALDHTEPGSLLYGNQIPYIPRHSGSATLRICYEDTWNLLWTSSFTGERWSRTANTADYRIAPFSLSDLHLSYRREHLSLALTLNNLLDTQYQVVQGYPMPGRNALLTVVFDW